MSNWPEIARQFADLEPVRHLDRKAVGYLQQLSADQPVLAACSGGPDSVFLFLCLHVLFADSPERLHLLHFNHGVRGNDADADAAFVRQMAGDLGHPFSIGQPESPLATDEAALRGARYKWLGTLYKETAAGSLVLGQHAGDLLETQLMALLSGSGPAGLATPMPVRSFPDGQVRLRPLLSLTREDLVAILDQVPVPYRNDASNEDTTYTRNWLRKEIVPLLEQQYPQDIHAGANRTRHLMEEAVEFLDHSVEELGLGLADPLRIDLKKAMGRSPALVRRILMAWWLQHYPDQIFPTRPVDALVKAIAAGRTGLIVPIGRVKNLGEISQVIEIEEDNSLILRPEKVGEPRSWGGGIHWHWKAGSLFLPHGDWLSGESVPLPENGPHAYKTANPQLEAWVAGVDGPLLVRQWMPGDRYQPLGAPGRRKVQDIFTDAKLNSEQKSRLPVILDTREAIVWIPGFPPAEAFRICHNHKSALKLTYNPQ
ncbi:MAG: tRNA lysidine(34) synthetase TilS [Puniceicoccaceae bacterium]